MLTVRNVINHSQRFHEILRHVVRHLKFDRINEKFTYVVIICQVVWHVMSVSRIEPNKRRKTISRIIHHPSSHTNQESWAALVDAVLCLVAALTVGVWMHVLTQSFGSVQGCVWMFHYWNVIKDQPDYLSFYLSLLHKRHKVRFWLIFPVSMDSSDLGTSKQHCRAQLSLALWIDSQPPEAAHASQRFSQYQDHITFF